MCEHFNCDIRTNNGAKATADTTRGIMHLGVEISPDSNIFRHRQNLLGTDAYAQFATLAMVLVYPDSGHKYLSRDSACPPLWFPRA